MKPEVVEVDWEALEDQKRYMAWLRRLPVRRLKNHHKTIFPKEHRFHMKLPGWCPRYYYERRLFYYYMARHYHLPNPWRQQFRKETLVILDYFPTDQTRAKDMQIVRELSDFRNFTPAGIANLPEDRIDVYLTRLGYMVDLPEDHKRQILFELFNIHTGDIVPRYSLTTGKAIRYKVSRSSLRVLIMENPKFGYPEMLAKYGPELPRMTKSGFYHARLELKKAGYKLPKLKVGRRSKAVIVKGRKTDLGKTIENYSRSSRHKREDPI